MTLRLPPGEDVTTHACPRHALTWPAHRAGPMEPVPAESANPSLDPLASFTRASSRPDLFAAARAAQSLDRCAPLAFSMGTDERPPAGDAVASCLAAFEAPEIRPPKLSAAFRAEACLTVYPRNAGDHDRQPKQCDTTPGHPRPPSRAMSNRRIRTTQIPPTISPA